MLTSAVTLYRFAPRLSNDLKISKSTKRFTRRSITRTTDKLRRSSFLRKQPTRQKRLTLLNRLRSELPQLTKKRNLNSLLSSKLLTPSPSLLSATLTTSSLRRNLGCLNKEEECLSNQSISWLSSSLSSNSSTLKLKLQLVKASLYPE
jgi:hypothetical protein